MASGQMLSMYLNARRAVIPRLATARRGFLACRHGPATIILLLRFDGGAVREPLPSMTRSAINLSARSGKFLGFLV